MTPGLDIARISAPHEWIAVLPAQSEQHDAAEEEEDEPISGFVMLGVLVILALVVWILMRSGNRKERQRENS